MSVLLKQYRQAKATCPEAVVLLRVGDFYEAFEDDAKLVAKVLGLRLATRNWGDDASVMTGFPYHYLQSHVERLVAAGHRVAVCEQVERTAAKGHEVTRVVTNDADDALIENDTDENPAATNPRPSTTVKCPAEKSGGEQRPTAAQ